MRQIEVACVVVSSLVASVQAQTITALVREGDAVGPSGHTVSALTSVRTNHAGGYAVGLNTSDGVTTLSHIWGNASGGAGSVLRTEATFDPLVQNSFESFFGISDSGSISYSPLGTGGPVGNFDSVWIDDTPIAMQGAPVQALSGQFWVFASRPGMTAGGEAWWVSGYGPSTSTTARALVRATDSEEVTLVLKTGDFVTGIADAVGPASVQFTFRMSKHGTNWLGEVVFAGAAATSNAMVRNNAVLTAGGLPVREGFTVPTSVGGDGIELYQNFDNNGINENGDWILTGDTNAAATLDGFLMVNGTILLREGQMFAGFPLAATMDGADINEDGDWVSLWSVNIGGSIRECVIVNGEMIIKETDPIDFDGDGIPDPGLTLTDITGIDNVAIGNRDASGAFDVYFTGDVSTTPTARNTAFRIRIAPTCIADIDDGSGTGTPDGGVTIEDLLYYLLIFDLGSVEADVDDGSGTGTPDGGVTIEDLLYFLLRFDLGC